jgi:DNA polymerase III alpha subunit
MPLTPAAAAAPQFVHLKVHSSYSLLEGALPIDRLAKLAVAGGFPAVGLTDSGNLFGALEFSEKLAEVGVQPIVGRRARRPGAQGRGRPMGEPSPSSPATRRATAT